MYVSYVCVNLQFYCITKLSQNFTLRKRIRQNMNVVLILQKKSRPISRTALQNVIARKVHTRLFPSCKFMLQQIDMVSCINKT